MCHRDAQDAFHIKWSIAVFVVLPCRSIVQTMELVQIQELCAEHPFFTARPGRPISPHEAAAIKATLELFAVSRDEEVEEKHMPERYVRR